MIDTPRRGASLGFAGSLEEFAITALDELHAITRETDGRLAQRVAGPGRCLDAMPRKQSESDSAIGLAFEPRIDSAKHLPKPLSAMRRNTGIRRCWRCAQAAPVASDRFQPVRGSVVEKDERGAGQIGFAEADPVRADNLVTYSNARGTTG